MCAEDVIEAVDWLAMLGRSPVIIIIIIIMQLSPELLHTFKISCHHTDYGRSCIIIINQDPAQVLNLFRVFEMEETSIINRAVV